MADGVDTAMQAMQTADAYPMVDSILAEADRDELPVRDDAMLAVGEIRRPVVQR